MAESVNQQIADRLTRRQLQIGRVETGLRRQVYEQLALLEQDVLAAIKSADPTQFALLARRRREVETLMAEELDPLIQDRYAHIAALLDAALMRLGTAEAAAVEQIVNEATGEETIVQQPSARRLRGGIVQGLFPSAAKPTDLSTTGADWWTRAGASLSQRLGDQLIVSASLEESLTQMTARVKGTSEQGFADGIMERARQDASRLLTTQTTNALNEGRVAVGDRNAQRLMAVHQSILDSHTCLDGDTLVRTPFGTLSMREVKAGQLVFGGSGQVRRVLTTHSSQTFQIARVTLSDGTVVLCTPDHQFLTQDFGWQEAQKLQENTVLRRDSML